MIQGIINTKKITEAKVVILSAPYEKTASSHKGTISGPKKIIKCLNSQIEFFDPKFKKEICHHLKIGAVEIKNLKNLEPKKALAKIRKESEKLLQAGKFVLLLGGEHSVSLGLIQALVKKYKPEEVTILQIDAHCDLRNDDSDYNSKNPSSFAHSTVMRRVSELGSPIVQVGIRTYSKEEYEYFKNPKNKIRVFEWQEKETPVSEILKAIQTKYVYLTLDVDGFDPSVFPGTGTPVPGGLSWNYGIKLLEAMQKKAILIGVDLVEVSPQKDTVLSEYSAASICYRLLADKFNQK